jgi:4a-hydroxytetrahydrobiopterin dehydratase
MELKKMKCVPCEGGIDPMTKETVHKYLGQIADGWISIGDKAIKKVFPFENFRKGMAFVNKIAEIAEREKHHPDICIHYSSVEVELFTHAIGGLSENDFILAAKIDEL